MRGTCSTLVRASRPFFSIKRESLLFCLNVCLNKRANSPDDRSLDVGHVWRRQPFEHFWLSNFFLLTESVNGNDAKQSVAGHPRCSKPSFVFFLKTCQLKAPVLLLFCLNHVCLGDFFANWHSVNRLQAVPRRPLFCTSLALTNNTFTVRPFHLPRLQMLWLGAGGAVSVCWPPSLPRILPISAVCVS